MRLARKPRNYSSQSIIITQLQLKQRQYIKLNRCVTLIAGDQLVCRVDIVADFTLFFKFVGTPLGCAKYKMGPARTMSIESIDNIPAGNCLPSWHQTDQTQYVKA